MRDLVVRLNELCDALPFQSSWYVKDMTSGQRADRFGGVPVPSASTRKISIMMAALAAVHAGKLSLDQKVTIDARFQDNDSGTFQHLTPGFSITLRDAMVMMIIVSDNTCTGHVVDLVGLANVQRYTEAVGLTGTVHRYGIPPKTGADNTLDKVTTTTANEAATTNQSVRGERNMTRRWGAGSSADAQSSARLSDARGGTVSSSCSRGTRGWTSSRSSSAASRRRRPGCPTP